MAQQETDQQHAGVLPVDDDGFVVDTEDCEEREAAYRERGTSRPITVVGNPVLHKECKDVTEFGDELAAADRRHVRQPAAPPRAWAWPPTRSAWT